MEGSQTGNSDRDKAISMKHFKYFILFLFLFYITSSELFASLQVSMPRLENSLSQPGMVQISKTKSIRCVIKITVKEL